MLAIIAAEPGLRLRDIIWRTGITETTIRAGATWVACAVSRGTDARAAAAGHSAQMVDFDSRTRG